MAGSQSRITIDKSGNVKAVGSFAPYRQKIAIFLREQEIFDATIHYHAGRFKFSANIDPFLHQRLRNFLVNECPLLREVDSSKPNSAGCMTSIVAIALVVILTTVVFSFSL